MRIRSKVSKDQENSQNSILKTVFANSIDHISIIHRALPKASALGAATIFLIAIFGLVGNQLPALKLLGSISEDYIPMAPSTAVCFILLSSIFLTTLYRSVPKQIWNAFIFLAVLVSLFGALEVAGTIIGLDLNFEDSIVPEAGYLGEMAIARMSPSTGALFFIAGLAVTALLFQRQMHLKGRFLEYFAGGFGTLVLITSFIFCGFYVYGSPLLYGQGSTIPMALTTAIAFILLGAVILIESQKNNSRVASTVIAKDNNQKIISSQIRFILLITIMVVVTLISISTMTLMLYRYDINQQKSQLIATAKGQARLIESIGRFNYSISEQVHREDPDYDPLIAVVNQVAEAHENYEQSGQSMEITLARREGDLIEFLVRHRHADSELPEPLRFDSELAVPQRRALLGQSGTIIGLDYHGERVLAAYEPVKGLGLGVVAKIDLVEIRAPFVHTVISGGIIALFFIIIGTIIFFLVSNPVIQRLEDHTQNLLREISEREKIKLELEKERTLLQTIIDTIPVMLVHYNPDADMLYLNKEFEKSVGWKTEDVKAINLIERLYPDPFYRREVLEYIKNATPEWHEFQIQSKSGKIIISEWSNIRMKDGTHLGIGINITERKQLEAQVRHQQKLESIGTLAGGVAHEINNPINGIMNYAQLISDRLDPGSPLREFSKGISMETERVASIVRNLLSFARQDKQAHSLASIVDIINNTTALIRTIIRRDQITLELEVPENLPKIKCRSQQIQQVLMNLLTNARDALNARYHEHDPDKIMIVSVHTFQKGGRNWLRTTVEDHGIGIPEEISDRLFDPFFTTKDRSRGTGLGLSISLGIVQDHHGELSFDSKNNQYTRFHLDLPVDNGWSLESDQSDFKGSELV